MTNTISLTGPTRGLGRALGIADVVPPLLATGLAGLALALRWQGADWPAQLFRIEVFRRAGFVVWNLQWYDGHHVLGYSVLAPAVGALLGPGPLAVATAAVAAACFTRLVRPVFGAAATVGALWFAAATVTNVAVGRLTFGFGMALGLAAALALTRRHTIPALALALACTLASPVAGVFLAISTTAWALTTRRPNGRVVGFAMTALAGAPIVVLGLIFPEGGTFRFNPLEFVATLAVCGGLVAALPREARAIRLAAILYAAAAVVVFLVPTPLGGNLGRFGMYIGGPLLACALWPARKLVLLAIAPFALVWQWNPAIDGIAFAGRDASSDAAYHTPLVHFLETRTGPPARVEIPFTREHWEAVYVASDVPLARGWERQLDRVTNPLFYDGPLTAGAYGRWLRAHAIKYVALPDAPLDPSARAEARIITHRPRYLEPVWRNDHWQVWRVLGTRPMVGGGHLVSSRPDSLTVDVARPGPVLVRVHYTSHWTLDGAGCVLPGPHGWTVLRVARAGPVQLRSTLLGNRGVCP
jgi:hypothetical protein